MRGVIYGVPNTPGATQKGQNTPDATNKKGENLPDAKKGQNKPDAAKKVQNTPDARIPLYARCQKRAKIREMPQKRPKYGRRQTYNPLLKLGYNFLKSVQYLAKQNDYTLLFYKQPVYKQSGLRFFKNNNRKQ